MAAEQDTLLPLSLGFLSEHLGYHLQLAQAAMRRAFAERLGEFDLTQKQYVTLHLVAQNEGASQIDIAAALDTDRSTIMALIERLEKRRLIARRRSLADGRRQELRITPQGTELLAEMNEIIQRHDESFAARFSPGELATLVEALRRIHRRS